MKAPGKSFLQVSGILLIIFSGIALIITGLGIAGYLAMDNPEVMKAVEEQALQTGVPVDKGSTLIGLILMSISVILNMTAGILGVKNCNNPQRAQSCFIVGAVIIVYQLANAVYLTFANQFNIFTTIIGLILPVLYVLGAIRNKSYQEKE